MVNNFFEEFFNSLVNAYTEEFLIKEEKQIEKVEKVQEKREEEKRPLIIRKFPIETPIKIEKIAAKELKPIKPIKEIPKEIPPPGAKERFLTSLKEFKPELMPSIEIKPKIEQKIEKQGFNFGKINEVVYNTNTDQVQITNDEKIVVAYKDGKIEQKEIVMSRDEIMGLLKRISERVKIPLEKTFSCYFEDFFIQAEINEKVKVKIKKLV